MRFGTFFLLTFCVSSCAEPEVKSVQQHYIDVKGFVDSEVNRLSKSNTLVNKTVIQNGNSESLSNINVNWKNELALFRESDINKSAWQDSYIVTKKEGSKEFHALDSNLRTKLILVRYDKNNKVAYLQIRNRTKNSLYQTDETLIYIPDSLYSVTKDQEVLFLGKNRYEIKGSLTH